MYYTIVNFSCDSDAVGRKAKNLLDYDCKAQFAKSNPPETPVLVEEQKWLLHHDNAPAHTSLRANFDLKNTIIMPQEPYSPDLAAVTFFVVFL